ncbi:transposase [Heliophilum fasciatum]|uniref:Uncharacterized protein n=1 Tax=Heliophilum fasciatum TaxID=35700 RepID=A0A4R2RLQ4_9FIRM|nr:transposase [Heliophilum fasciatum]MCW2278986.1 hypothetical protein [Heliophilum fasciatum]TCP64063.1 hypothetical protein EDD73_11224 [Heliophilum fasciatum]
MAGQKGAKHFDEATIQKAVQMKMDGKTHMEICVELGFRNKKAVKELLLRQRRKMRRVEAGIKPLKKGRPRKDAPIDPEHNEQVIKRLKMENELLRAFRFELGRR